MHFSSISFKETPEVPWGRCASTASPAFGILPVAPSLRAPPVPAAEEAAARELHGCCGQRKLVLQGASWVTSHHHLSDIPEDDTMKTKLIKPRDAEKHLIIHFLAVHLHPVVFLLYCWLENFPLFYFFSLLTLFLAGSIDFFQKPQWETTVFQLSTVICLGKKKSQLDSKSTSWQKVLLLKNAGSLIFIETDESSSIELNRGV